MGLEMDRDANVRYEADDKRCVVSLNAMKEYQNARRSSSPLHNDTRDVIQG